MKRRISVFIAVVAALACRPAELGTVTISVIGTNDLHGAVSPTTEGRGGLALLDGYIRNLRAARDADRGGVLLIDAGDLFQGTLESNLNEGAVVVAAYNAMGYAASAVGNHEFDFGPVGEKTGAGPADDPRGALKARASEARFPFLTANIIDNDTGRPVQWPHIQPSTIVDVAGVRVGIVGLATRSTLAATLAANTRGLSIAPLAPALAAESARLRTAGASIVVATAHAGGECRRFDNSADLSSCLADSEIFDVARSLPPGSVDLIVAGHRHEGIAHMVAGIPIISSYSSGRAFGRVDLVVDRRTHSVKSRIFPPHNICEREETDGTCAPPGRGVVASYEGRPVSPSQTIKAILAPAVDRANELRWASLNAIVATPLRRGDEAEDALGNLLADWMRRSAGTDAAVINGGGIRADLPAGPLTYGSLFEAMPFDNLEVVVALTGAELRRSIGTNLARSGSFMHLSGVRARARCDGSTLSVDVVRENGVAIRDDETISVAMPDFLATGGDRLFDSPRVIRGLDDGPVQREHIAAWLKEHGGTWRPADPSIAANRRIVYSGARPVRCTGS